MRIISAKQISERLDFPDFIEALRQGFCSDLVIPVRHHHEIEIPDEANSTLLLMPAWTDFKAKDDKSKKYIGVKIVNVVPTNAKRGKASVQAQYLLNDGETGEPIALIDGQALTFWRTSCASALASDYLSNRDAKTLLMVGAGELAPWLIKAHCAVRPIEQIKIWNRNPKKAQALATKLSAEKLPCEFVADLRGAVESSDIISAATLSHQALICGDWLNNGTHVDLVGGFTPDMREADDGALERASVFVDTFAGALSEAGDIIQPLENGTIKRSDILADLHDLTAARHPGRTSSDQITLFKSTGTSLEDLVAAILISERIN